MSESLSGLAGALFQQLQGAPVQQSGGLLGKVLDQDGDGDLYVSDLMKLGSSLFGRR